MDRGRGKNRAGGCQFCPSPPPSGYNAIACGRALRDRVRRPMPTRDGSSIAEPVGDLKTGGDSAAQPAPGALRSRILGSCSAGAESDAGPHPRGLTTRGILMDDTRSTMSGDRPPRPSERVDELCDRFEAAWRESRAPRIEGYLAKVEAADRAALCASLCRWSGSGGASAANGQPPAMTGTWTQLVLHSCTGRTGIRRSLFCIRARGQESGRSLFFIPGRSPMPYPLTAGALSASDRAVFSASSARRRAASDRASTARVSDCAFFVSSSAWFLSS